MRVPIFWILFGTFFVCGCSTNGLIQTHFVTLCHDYGLAATTAASVLAMMGFFDFFGTIGSGWLSDRFDPRWLLFWYYGLRGLSLLYLPFTDFSFYGLSLFAVFYGLDWIATVPPTVKLTADRFGRERAGIVFGWVFAGHQIGAASAAFGAGLVRTEYSTYLPAFFVAGALCIIAALAVISVRKPSGAIGRRGCAGAGAGLGFSASLSILSQISAAISAPPKFFTARMPVGEVTLISVRKPPITSMPTNNSPRSRSGCGQPRADFALARGQVGRLGYAAAHHVGAQIVRRRHAIDGAGKLAVDQDDALVALFHRRQKFLHHPLLAEGRGEQIVERTEIEILARQ